MIHTIYSLKIDKEKKNSNWLVKSTDLEIERNPYMGKCLSSARMALLSLTSYLSHQSQNKI